MTGFVPARLSIFKLAFSHKSNQATKDYAQTNNERLEYLGDAVLGTIVAEYLFKKYPNGDEGFLTKMRSKIVKRKSLNDIGDQMGLDVLLSEYNRTRLSSSMLGNAVEALVGAVYLEKGYRATKRFVIQRMLKLYVDMHELETVDDNYKSQLLEYCQKNGMQVNYKLLNKFKQDRRDRFKVAVMVNGEQVSLADDFNKKSAEQLASLRALQRLGLIDKADPAHDTRQVPAKAPSKKISKPKKASPKREPKPAQERGAKDNNKVSDEQLAVQAINKRNNTRPKQVREEKPKPVEARKEQAKGPAAQPQVNKSSAAMPARKQRRNNTRLGRAIWNGIQTAGTGINIVDDMGYFEKPEVHTAPKPAIRRKKARVEPAVAKQEVKNDTQAATSNDLRAAQPKTPKKAKPVKASKPSSPRKRRPIPLRLLTPIVKDASAVMAIDFADLFAKEGAPRTPHRNQPLKGGRQRRAKVNAPASKPVSPTQEKTTEDTSWEDTPLGLAAESTTVVNARPSKAARQEAKKGENVNAETLDEWEDTLLEFIGESSDLETKLPDIYKTSAAPKAPNRRRRPQRRNTNRKKKTEE